MTLTSFSFFAFLLVSLFLYYIFKDHQKYVLFAVSVFFYVAVSGSHKLDAALMLLYVSLVTYFGARLISNAKENRKKAVFIISLLLLLLTLFIFKYLGNLALTFKEIFQFSADVSVLSFVSFIGMSYFVLCACGYIIDVYWGLVEADKNYFEVALFVFFFPQIISGPITRFNTMKEQFQKKHALMYDNITNGLRRMLWGYFKKLVISERFALVVNGVYEYYTGFGGLDILLATLCYAVQLYTDFSGCMDIVIGAAQMFSVELPENFNAPFFSESLQEFWQRWHITLGKWFKDYVMYPVQISRPMVNLGKRIKKKWGKKVGKKIPFYISMFVLWLSIGLWHGGLDFYFVASAGVPFAVFLIGDLLEPLFNALNRFLHINPERGLFKVLKYLRTSLILCLVWVFVCAKSVSGGFDVIRVALSRAFVATIPTVIKVAGLGKKSLVLMGAGLVILFLDELLCFKGYSIRKKCDKLPAWIRTVLIYAEVAVILLYGMVGSSSFIYFKF